MSTYGTVAAIDVAPDGDVAAVSSVVAGWDAYGLTLPSGWTRVTCATTEVEQVDAIGAVLAAAGTARAAIAEDYDEYGALWVVLECFGGLVRPVHRRYVLNADPGDPGDVALAVEGLGGTDPRVRDLAGPVPAAEAALVFGVDPAPVIAAEESAASAYERLGVVGGPFPWWPALGLTWPGREAGDRLG